MKREGDKTGCWDWRVRIAHDAIESVNPQEPQHRRAGRKTERKQKSNKSCTQDYHRADSNIARALLQAHLSSISSHITVFFTHQ